jgi:uncharacterized protein (TIGR03435 family)
VSSAFAQTFETASIRLSGPQSVRGSDGGPGHKDPTRFIYGRAELMSLITMAYGVDSFQVSSRVSLDEPAFDVVANVPAGATKEQFRVMLQNLLAERFALKTHMESRDFPAYELVVAKGGLKMKEAVPGEPPSAPHGDGWPPLRPDRPDIASGMSGSAGYILIRLRSQLEPISVLAGMLASPGDPPIVDKTGLTGKYSFNLEYTKDSRGPVPDVPPVAPDLNTALGQLGLQIVPKKLPFDVVVVDSFNRLPTEN